MASDYFCYTERKRKDGTWHAINGMYYDESVRDYVMSNTYRSGSRSYFGRTYDKMREMGHIICASELSEEVRKVENWFDDDYDSIVAVSLKDIVAAVEKSNRKSCCGYVHKRNIWSHEVEHDEINEYYSAAEYNELTKAEQKEYEFYEWDDPMDWPIHLRGILDSMNYTISTYRAVNSIWNDSGEIRLVCIYSY